MAGFEVTTEVFLNLDHALHLTSRAGAMHSAKRIYTAKTRICNEKRTGILPTANSRMIGGRAPIRRCVPDQSCEVQWRG